MKRAALFGALALLLSSCAGPRAALDADATRLLSRLEAEVRSWDGTPHRWGGSDRSGADCSGFVMRVYEDALGISLPRTTEAMARTGSSVRYRDLAPGDLVFFRIDRKTRHVGIYLDEERFAHASSSDGVTVSRLSSDYWNEAYWMARRVADDAPTPHPVHNVDPRPSPVTGAAKTGVTPSRVGW